MRFPLVLHLAATQLLVACERQPQQLESLPPDAAAELRELMERVIPAAEKDELGELTLLRHVGLGNDKSAVLKAYNKSGQVRALNESPPRITPLHVAVMFRREALARELLRQGADPNATIGTPEWVKLREGVEREMDAPLVWTVTYSTGMDKGCNTDTSLRLIDLLVAHGAEVKGKAGGHTLMMSTLCSGKEGEHSWEDVFIHLLELGADTRLGYTPDNAAMCHRQVLRHGWLHAARLLLDKGFMGVNEREDNGQTLFARQLNHVACSNRYHEEGEDVWEEEEWQRGLATLRFLLENGADVNALQGEERDYTPLAELAENMPGKKAPDEQLARFGELVLLLTERGADLNTPVRWGKGTVAERFRRNAKLVEWLRAHSVELPEKP